MNEFFGAAGTIGPFLTAVLVPFVGGILVPALGVLRGSRDPAAVRSMSRHAKLHDALPEAAREPVRKLIQFEAEKYVRATMRRGTRKFSWGMLRTLVAFVVLLVPAELALIASASLWWPAYIVAGLIGGFGGALLGYGSRQLFEYEEGDPLSPSNSEEEVRRRWWSLKRS